MPISLQKCMSAILTNASRHRLTLTLLDASMRDGMNRSLVDERDALKMRRLMVPRWLRPVQ